jgi:hypothetical protein
VAWSAPGVSAGFIDYVDVFSTAVEPVLLGDSNPDRNKAVSNLLATGWEDHKNHDINIDGPVHGIGYVDVTDTDGTLTKLVSNFYANRWTVHESTNFDGTYDILAPPTNPHGIQEIDLVLTGNPTIDQAKNRLISIEMAKKWEDHANDITGDPHPQYSLIDGSKAYTAKVGYPTGSCSGGVGGETNRTECLANGGSWSGIVVGTLDAEDFVTRDMIASTQAVVVVYDSLSTDPNIGQYIDGTYYEQLTDNGDGTFSVDFVHNLSIQYPFVIVWKLPEQYVISPENILRIDANTTRVTIAEDTGIAVRITGHRFSDY